MLSNLFSSVGLKRLISAALSALLGIAPQFPQVQPLILVLQWLAGVLGGVGVVHAVSVGTLGKGKLSSLASVFATLALLAGYVPALAPYAHILQELAALFGAAGVGTVLGAKALPVLK